MLQNMIVVAGQVLMLFLMIGVGWFCARKKILSAEGADQLSRISLNIVTPCVVINSLQRERDPELLKDLLMCIGIGIVTIGLGMLLSGLLFRQSPSADRRVLRFAMSYPNSGYMGIPLVQAVLGDKAVLYAVGFVIAFNLMLWTAGVCLMGDKKDASFKKAVLNPGTVSFAIGIALFALNIRLAGPIGGAVTMFADLNTPVAMLAIGIFVASTKLSDCFLGWKKYGVCALRMILMPAIMMGLMMLLHLKTDMATALIICASAPTAAVTSMFAARYRLNTALASQMVTLCTLLSILTMPIFAALARQWI